MLNHRIRLLSIFKKNRRRVVFAEKVTDKLVHWRWTTVNVDCCRVVKRTNLLENLVSHITLIMFPTFGRIIQNIMNPNPVTLAFYLFSENYVLFVFVSEQKNKLNLFILHAGYFHHSLEHWCDSAPSSHEKYSLSFITLLILI